MSEHEFESIDDLKRALDRFDEALAIPISNPLAIDGTIQRFEFCFELSWKAIKVVALYYGSDKRSPREAIKAAYGYGWIDDEDVWIAILKDRNLSSHTYREAIALDVYERLPHYAIAMRGLALSLSAAIQEKGAT